MGIFSCLETINAKTMSEVIAVSAEGNYLYTTKVPRPDSDEDASEIGSLKRITTVEWNTCLIARKSTSDN